MDPKQLSWVLHDVLEAISDAAVLQAAATIYGARNGTITVETAVGLAQMMRSQLKQVPRSKAG